MPPTTSKSKLASKLGSEGAAAVVAHANDETHYGFIELPPNFQGIAKLSKCYFKEYENGDHKGQFFFRAQAIVQDPVTFATPNGVIRSRGLMTSIQIPLCDTTTKTGKNAGNVTTAEEHIADVLEEMRRLGGETFTDGATLDQLEDLARTLEETPDLYFVFSTSSASGDRKPFHNWHGTRNLPIDYVPSVEGGEAGGMVEDNDDVQDQESAAEAGYRKAEAAQKAIEKTMAAASASKNGKPSTAKAPMADKPPRTTPLKPNATKPAPAPEPESDPDEGSASEGDTVDESEAPDLDALVEDANNGESDTQTESAEKLVELAMEAGHSEDDARNAESWDAVADLIRSGVSGEGEAVEEEPEPDEPTGPAAGDTVSFFPIDPKTKKPVKKAVNAEITVLNDNDTVNLKAGKAVYKNIALSALHDPE